MPQVISQMAVRRQPNVPPQHQPHSRDRSLEARKPGRTPGSRSSELQDSIGSHRSKSRYTRGTNRDALHRGEVTDGDEGSSERRPTE